ncbi:YqfD [Candidatus Syntrophocurvum alkaliphilum]|uniref:YqfD n=1 Tax=Candidatus Syntrophocurvum alkaliphilum TaxID=2293317 RepID=A0A6I6DG19_9FIRM|nr:sporulation protein YqfD [Candidatus Syntrophocurvum alkaliphilum]QGT99987.1 YqfD [Candidatus Syntrophocurvum alkaliphilum]
MANKLFDQVSGIIEVSLRGKGQEKIINMALTRGIYIWDIKKSAERMTFKVRTSGFDALQTIAEENNFELEITNRSGLPYYKNILKRRVGFITGALIFIFALYLMSSFIWFVEVSGNNTVDKSKIVFVAAQQGVHKGAPKWSFSKTEVEEALLRNISELSYVQLNIRGVKANIKVVEKVLPNEEITGPCHIVASKDGVIEEILLLDGQANVKVGDVVSRGDILISGIVFPPEQEVIEESDESIEEVEPTLPYTVRARGVVKARVWYEGYGECSMISEKQFTSGKEAKKIYLETPWRTINIRGDRNVGFPEAEQKITKQTLNTPLGEFNLFKVTIKEKIKKVTEYSEEEAIKIAKEKAMQELEQKMQNSGKIKDTKVEILSAPSDSILRVKVIVESIEDIALPEPIIKETENSN